MKTRTALKTAMMLALASTAFVFADSEIEVRGPVESLTASTLTVASHEITVCSATRIEGEHDVIVPFSSLRVGDLVEVEARVQADGTMFAVKIQIEDHNEKVELKGTIQAIGSDSLVVGGTTVVVSDATLIRDEHDRTAMFTDLVVGMLVEIEGTRQTDASILATKIDIDDRDDEEEVHLEATIEAVGSGWIQVLGRIVYMQSTTTLEGRDHQSISFSDLIVGIKVEVEGTAQPDGSVLARKIKADVTGGGDSSSDMTGRITALSKKYIDVDTRHFSWRPSTRVQDASGNRLRPSDLSVGQQVRVEYKRSGKKLMAREILIIS